MHVFRPGLLRAAAAVSLLLAACTATTRIETNKDPSYTKEPKRLLVIESLAWDVSVDKPFHAAPSDRLKTCGITAAYIQKMTSDPFSPAAVALSKRFRPDTILQVNELSRDILTRNGQPAGVLYLAYGLELRDVATDRPVWKAEEKLFPKNDSFADAGEVLARNIVDKLAADGIFRSCPAEVGEKG
jgi:hypothetical protein